MTDKPPPADFENFVDEEEDEGPSPRTLARRHKKAVVEDRVARVEALVGLSEADFAALSLPADVQRELTLARRLKLSGARQRQIRYVAKLLAGREGVLDETGQPGIIDRWLAHFRAEGEPAIEAFLRLCPSAERQRLRQLLRTGDEARLQRYLAELDPPAPDEEPADLEVETE